jgi:hypothetical protein
MKHLKLYESFEQHEFGEIDLMAYQGIVKSTTLFPENDMAVFVKFLDSNNLNYEIRNNDTGYYTDDLNYEIVRLSMYGLECNVHHIGDYCYAFSIYDSSNHDEHLTTLDQIDGVIDYVKELILNFSGESDSINESFDRHDFGKADPSTYSKMRKCVEHFPNRELSIISGILNDNNIKYGMFSINEDIDGLNQNFDIFIIEEGDVCIEIYYLGDYCFGLYSYGGSGLVDEFDEYPINHTFLDVVDGVDELLNAILVAMKRLIG